MATGQARLAITAPATVGTTSIPIHVDVTGDASADDLVIALVEPGDASTPDLPRFVAAGVAPATGAGNYLGADGTWTRDVQIAATAPVTHDRVVALPTSASGEWALTAELRDHDGRLVAIDSASVLVSAEPALQLSLGGAWMPAERAVRATARIAHGGRDDIGVVAWLTLPDGSQLSLPDLQPALAPALIQVEGDKIELLDRSLALQGAGDYGIGVRLVDTTSGTVLGAASAGFTVCATNGHVAGTVRDESGTMLGAGASRAVIDLASVDDPGTVASAVIGADGTYAADVPVGRWFVRGTVVDGAGSHDIAAQAVVVGCVTTAILDLEAAPAVAAAQRARRVPLWVPPPAAPQSCSDNAMVILVKTRARDSLSILSFETDRVVEKITAFARETTNANELVFRSTPELESDLYHARSSQGGGSQAGTDMNLITGVRDTLRRADFFLVVNVQQRDPAVDMYDFTLDLADAVNAVTIELETARAKRADWNDTIEQVTASLLVGIVPELRQHVRPIVNAKLALSTTPAHPIAGQMFSFSAVLTDAQSCRLAPQGTPVTIEELANTPPLVTAGNAMTDRAGVATVQGVAPSTTAVGKFQATYTYPDRSTHAEELVVGFGRAAANGLELSADKIRLGVGDVAHGVAVFPNHPNTMLSVTATRGTIDHSTIVTDSSGRATFTFTATTPGLANAEVRTMPMFATDDADSNVGFWVDAPLAITLSTPMQAIHTNTLAPIVAKVELSGGQPAVGIPIQFEVTSGGGVVSTTVATTGADGRTGVVFTAPGSAGTSEITASGSLDSARAQDVLAIQILAPCAGCPIAITTDQDVVPKNGTSHFYANQLVTWSVNSGSINPSSGVFTASNAGGVWTVTATSLENPGQTGHLDFIVECSDVELGMPHAATPGNPLGGGRAYTIHQTVTNAASCASNGSYDGVMHIYSRLSPTPSTVDLAQEIMPPTCVSDLFGFGATQFLPTISGCHISQITQVQGCYVEQLEVQVFGPGIAGISGFLHEGHYDGATTTCSTFHDITFTSQ